MSGAPTEAEIQAQWTAAVDLLDTVRNLADTSIVGGGGKLDVLIQSLEGEYTPVSVASAAASFRSGLSNLASSGTALSFLRPILFEYGNLISQNAGNGYGGSSSNVREIAVALYEYFHSQSYTVKSRGITYDTSVTAGSANVGNGALSRLTEDWNGYDLEACHVETKKLRCVSDENTGTRPGAEQFEVIGEAQSQDFLEIESTGSGVSQRRVIVSKHAGTGSGGSILDNSSFSSYSSTGTPKFSGWTEVAGGANIAQDTTNFYRTHPSATVDASLRINGGSGQVLLRQQLSAMRVRSLEPDTPYFLRMMVNAEIGTADGGNVIMRLGSTEVSTAITSLSEGWNEIVVPFDSSCWFRSFNEADLAVEIEWPGTSNSGFLLVDDVILCPWDQIDGTFWLIRQNAASPVNWKVDDILTVTDTGGAATTGKIQRWAWLSGLGYFPSTTGTPTIDEPA